MKKLTSYLIAFMMVFTMIPGIAFADSEGEPQNIENKIFYMEFSDPIEGDGSSDGEVMEITPFSARDAVSEAASADDYATTIEGAASALREGMVNRQSEVQVAYRMDDWGNEPFSIAANAILDEAEKHTGAPSEGDCLRWVKGPGSMSGSAWSDGTYYYATIVYSLTYYTTAEQEKELDAAVDALLAEIITDDMTDYAKVKAIYDYMTANISYDYDNLDDESHKLKYTAYAALINKTAVCQGYAILFYRLALECGIDARLISGDATNSLGETGGHGWNIVKLGDKYYLVDATWDTSRANVGVPYDYFLKASYDDHFADAEYKTEAFTTAYPMASKDYEVCTNHTLEVLPAVPATCSEAGMTEGSKCTNCGEIITPQKEVAALGHDEITHVAQAPTCIAIGWDAYVTCSRCDYTTYNELGKVDHSFTTTVKDATCEAAGLITNICTVCEYQETETIPQLRHKLTTHKAQAPTCTEVGWPEYYTCSRCDYTTYTELAATGHSYAWVVDVEATEDAFGIKHEECTACHIKRNENTVIPKLDHVHDMVREFAKAATCTQPGNIEYYYCDKCKKYFADAQGQLQVTEEEIIIAPPGHVYSDWVIKENPTCTAEGLKYKSCKCASTIIEKIPVLGHDIVHHDAKAAGCISIGWDAYDTCSRCDYTTYREVAATGHNFIWVVESPATDMAAGVKHEECTGCGEKRSENTVIPKLDCVHSMVKTEGAAATCTTAGVAEHYTCIKCEKVFADEEGQLEVKDTKVPALGHDYVNHPAQAPTCTEIGWDAYDTCRRCDYTTYKELPAKGHDERRTGGMDPECESYGYTEGWYCYVCDEILVMQEVIEPLGHDIVIIPAVEPTCTEDGRTEGYRCTRCYEFKEPGEVIPATGHSYGAWTTSVAPTCTAAGTQVRSCACGHQETQSVAALGHTWETEYTVDKTATTGRPGSKSYHCAVCDAIDSASVTKIARIKQTTAATVEFNGKIRNGNVTVVDFNGKKLVKGRDFTVVYKNGKATKVVTPKAIGNYTAVVTFKGDYSGTVSKKFSITPKATVITKLAKPAKKQIKVTWQKRTVQVTGYQVRVSLKQNMANPRTVTVAGFKKNTTTIKNLKAKKKYWVQVRTYKTVNGVKVFSAWSAKRTIVTK